MDSTTDNSFNTSNTGVDAARDPNKPQADIELINRVAKSAHDAIDRLALGVNSAGHTLQDQAGHAREVGEEWTQTLRMTVRDNPLVALATALAIGALIGKLSRN